MKMIVLFFAIGLALPIFGQVEPESQDSLKEYFGAEVAVYDKDYMNTYNRFKRIIVKVYPYALYAADVIDEIDANAENISRRRKKNAFYKDEYKTLKSDFKYFILDLYTSEGEMLMKLIHRETGMTIYEISSKYQSKQKAEVFGVMAKLWDQNLHAKFDDSNRNDKIALHVLADIESGLIPFDDEIVTIDKIDYKAKQKKQREWKRQNQKRNKEYEKQRKERMKEQEKREKQKEKSIR